MNILNMVMEGKLQQESWAFAVDIWCSTTLPLFLGIMKFYLFHYRPLLSGYFKLLLISNICSSCHYRTNLVSCNLEQTEMFLSLLFLSYSFSKQQK